MRNYIIKKIEIKAKKYFKGTSGCHDWSHVERVKNLAIKIGKKEKANLFIIEVASILHDIGRKEEFESRGKVCHAERGVELAKEILANFKLKKDDINNILHCILSHRYRNSHIPSTLEAKILSDADKLDAIGAIGIGRAFLFAGGPGSKTLYTGREKKIAKKGFDRSYTKDDSATLEYEIKLKYIKDKILTKTGKKIAQQRHKFMENFFREFWGEVEGK